jgi:hypothetical protein
MDIAMKPIYLVLALLLGSTANAGQQYSGDSIQKLYMEMQYLYQAGIGIHQQFPTTTDRAELKACTSEYGYIGTRAKATVGIANRLEHPAKEELINAAWRALSCAKCSSPLSSCDPLPDDLKNIKNIMAEDYRKQNLEQE